MRNKFNISLNKCFNNEDSHIKKSSFGNMIDVFDNRKREYLLNAKRKISFDFDLEHETENMEEEKKNLVGRWSKDENIQFVDAILLYENNWKKINSQLKDRTLTQARSHSQKFFEKIYKRNILDSQKRVVSLKTLSKIVFSLNEKEFHIVMEILYDVPFVKSIYYSDFDKFLKKKIQRIEKNMRLELNENTTKELDNEIISNIENPYQMNLFPENSNSIFILLEIYKLVNNYIQLNTNINQ